jgi:hypothetical protein
MPPPPKGLWGLALYGANAKMLLPPRRPLSVFGWCSEKSQTLVPLAIAVSAASWAPHDSLVEWSSAV